MKHSQCARCGTELPLGKLVSTYQELLCTPCANAKLKEMGVKAVDPRNVYRLTDPTVCVRCEADGGDGEFRQVGGMPHCPQCIEKGYHRPFPLWLRAAAALLLALTVFGLVRAVGYVKARLALNHAVIALFAKGDVDGAQTAAMEAFKRVPESKLTRGFMHYFTGLQALHHDDDTALQNFSSVGIPLNEGQWKLQFLLKEAQLGSAFEHKKFPRALALSRELLQSDPQDVELRLGVASMAAALYADQGDAAAKAEAEQTLAQVGASIAKAPAGEKATLEYEIKRVRHRLETRQILNRKEYQKKFGPAPRLPQAKETKQS